MWDGANPQSSARRRDASDVGRPPFGAALYSRLPAAHEARGRSSPSRVTIADAGKEGVPPPSPANPPGGRQGRRTGSPNFAERKARGIRSFSLRSARRNRLPQRGGPADASPCGLAPLSPPASPPGRRYGEATRQAEF